MQAALLGYVCSSDLVLWEAWENTGKEGVDFLGWGPRVGQ